MNQRRRRDAVPLAASGTPDSEAAVGKRRPKAAPAYGVPVASTVYVRGVEPGSSRATVALGVTELLSRRVHRLGAFRPLVRTDPDPILDQLRSRYHFAAAGFGAPYTEAMELIAAGRVNDLVERIVDAFQVVDEKADAAVVIGTDFGRDGGDARDGNGLADELALNARLAIEMHATVLPVIDAYGRDGAAVRRRSVPPSTRSSTCTRPRSPSSRTVSLRLGYAPASPATPRRPLADLLAPPTPDHTAQRR